MASSLQTPVSVVDAHQLASVIKNRVENVLVVDSRSFIEHNACHIASSVNVCCSKIVKRRLQQDKLSVKELLMHTCHCDVDEKLDVVVYDQAAKDPENLPPESFTVILLKKLQSTFRNVTLLSGGFQEFHQYYPSLCEDKTRKCATLSSLSQPCLPIANQGPTKILPFLYLGSQFDAMNKELLRDHNITYELNVSSSCPQPEFVPEGHFMRIPVNDTYTEKLLPFFPDAFNFLDKVREGSGCVLVHCLAGISRSPTVAIAYVMRYLHLSSDDGYRYVKSKRPTISPNFNFLGQLLEYEKQLRQEKILDAKPEITSAPPICSKKRVCRTDMRTSNLSLDIDPQKNVSNFFPQPRSGDQSPTTALAKLSFDVNKSSSNIEETLFPSVPDFRQFRSKSCYGDWLRERDEPIPERKSKENSLSPAAKILSPVKEIKCDALISEISTGATEQSTLGYVRQRVQSYQFGENRHFESFSGERYKACSSKAEERFSIQTLSHQPYSPRHKLQDFSKTQEKQKNTQFSRSSSLQFHYNQSSSYESKGAETFQTESGSKRMCHMPFDRSKELDLKREKTGSNFMSRAALSKDKSSFLPFSFNIDSLKDLTSRGHCSYLDGAENISQANKKSEQFRLDIDFEKLKENLTSRLSDRWPKHGSLYERPGISPLFRDAEMPEWAKKLTSQFKSSNGHFPEKSKINSGASGSSSRSCSSFPSEDRDSFHDSSVPMPQWACPRKRTADFETSSLSSGSSFPMRDKRKCEPLTDPRTFSQRVKTLWFLKSESSPMLQQDDSTLFKKAYQLCDNGNLGLYRVQSCPVMISQASSFYTAVDQSKYPVQSLTRDSSCYSGAQEIISYESCPDVLHLESVESTHRQRECRRNVRCIQVS